jgi:gliding motility-associated-like protein
MKLYSFFFIAILLSVGNLSAGSSDKHKLTEKEQKQFIKSLRGDGMMFTQNQGQIVDIDGKLHPDILFKSSINGVDVYLRKTGISYVRSNLSEVMYEIEEQIEKKEKNSKGESDELKQYLMQKALIKTHRLDVDFSGANVNPEIQTARQVEGYTNYYYAHCPQGINNVNSYNEVTIKNIYNNIDVKYNGGKEHGLKYDIIVNPGADPNLIKLKYSGYKTIKIKNKNLCIETDLGTFEENLPKVYQLIKGEIINIKTNYILFKNQKNTCLQTNAVIGFKIGIYNSSYPLIIDPFIWATYYGGNRDDISAGLTVDKQENVLISGSTLSTNFPVGANMSGLVFQSALAGGANLWDAVVVKFSSDGMRIWATYYGGSDVENASSIALDPLNNAIITGWTHSSDFPIGSAPLNTVFQNTYKGSDDAFIVKLSPNGSRRWASYYGGSNREHGHGIATDFSGNIAITGYTSSNDFPVGANISNSVFQPIFADGTDDAIVVKFDSIGTRLWATFYGGGMNSEWGNGIVTDFLGNIIITGTTASFDFPYGDSTGVANFLRNKSQGYNDAFIVKFYPNGTRVWATCYGGIQNDYGNGIAIDLLGNIVIVGNTTSTDFPVGASVGNTTSQPTYGGGVIDVGDAFVAKFTPTGNRLWATYEGGSTDEYGFKCATDNNGNIYILGEFQDRGPGSFPIGTCALQKTFGGGPIYGVEDWFISKFNPAGQRICSTFIGGPGEDDLDGGHGGLATYQNYVYVTGASSGFPVTSGAFQTTQLAPNDVDIVVAKFCGNSCGDNNSIKVGVNPMGNVCNNSPILFNPVITSNLTCDTNSYLYHWYFPGATPSYSLQQKPDSVFFSAPGIYTLSLVVDGTCIKDSVSQTITVVKCCTLSLPSVLATNPTCNGTNNGSATANVSNGISPYTYLWSNTQTGTDATGLTTGTYTVTVTDGNNCSTTATVALTEPSSLILSTSSKNTTCGTNNGTIAVTVTGGTPIYTYSWSNGTLGQTAGNLTAAVYTVTATDANGCIAILTDTIINIAGNSINITPTLQTIKEGDSVFVIVSGGITYNWLPTTGLSCGDCASPTARPIISTVYTVTATDTNGCTATAAIDISVKKNCLDNADIFIANVFSPNNDGKNDILYIEGNGLTNIYWTIYDRWGNLLFETNDQSHGWDGTRKGELIEPGTYVYYLKATCIKTSSEIKLKGNVSILK